MVDEVVPPSSKRSTVTEEPSRLESVRSEMSSQLVVAAARREVARRPCMCSAVPISLRLGKEGTRPDESGRHALIRKSMDATCSSLIFTCTGAAADHKVKQANVRRCGSICHSTTRAT